MSRVGREARATVAVAGAVAVLALGVRLRAIAAVPVMAGGDSYTRLGNIDATFVHTWLPGYQLTLRALAALTDDPAAFRILTASEGALGAAAMALLVGAARGPAAAAAAGAVVALCPAQVLPALGLYQEPLFVALVAGGLLGAARGRAWGALLLLAAAWTRYEGWAAAGLGALLLPARLAWIPLLGPLVWVASRGLGGPWLDPAATVHRAREQVGILRALGSYWVGWPLVGLAGLGLVLRRTPSPVAPAERAGTALLALAVLDLLAVGVLRPFSPPDNARQLVVPTLALAVLAGRLATGESVAWRAGVVAMVALAAGWRLPAVVHDVQGWAGAGEDARRAALGEAVRARIGPAERLLVLSPGGARWDGVEPDGCLFVAVWARLPRSRVVCDTEVPAGDPEAWLRASDVGWIVVVGEGTLPAHALARGGGAEEVEPGVLRIVR